MNQFFIVICVVTFLCNRKSTHYSDRRWEDVNLVFCLMFFQVLKTSGYVDVKQQEAYGDIAICRLPKLDQIFLCDGGLLE